MICAEISMAKKLIAWDQAWILGEAMQLPPPPGPSLFLRL